MVLSTFATIKQAVRSFVELMITILTLAVINSAIILPAVGLIKGLLS
jgi:hypothetical protein